MKTQLAEIPTRVYKNRFNTGIYELTTGGLALVGGISLSAGNQVLMFVLFILGVVIVSCLIQRIEQRYIYPRSGYVKFREEGSQLWKNMLLGLGGSIMFWFVFFFDIRLRRRTCPGLVNSPHGNHAWLRHAYQQFLSPHSTHGFC